MFWAESTTKDYITAKNNVQSASYLLCMQVIKPQIIQKPQNQSWHKLSENIAKHQTQIFRRISPFGIALLKKQNKKKHIRLGQAGIMDHSIDKNRKGPR